MARAGVPALRAARAEDVRKAHRLKADAQEVDRRPRVAQRGRHPVVPREVRSNSRVGRRPAGRREVRSNSMEVRLRFSADGVLANVPALVLPQEAQDSSLLIRRSRRHLRVRRSNAGLIHLPPQGR